MKSSRKVRFDIQEPLEVKFKLTAQANRDHTIYFTFFTEATTTKETNTLFDAIASIEATPITLDNLDKDNLRIIRKNLRTLLQLSCISKQTKDYIKKGIYLFFDRIITHAPLNSTTLGHPGSRDYIEKLTLLNTKVQLINHTLNTLGIHKVSLKLSLFKPQEPGNHFNMTGLPQSPLDFKNSLNLNAVENINRWKTHFDTLSSSHLQCYLSKMLSLIERLEDDNARQAILTQLKIFILHFENTPYTSQMALFSEMLHMGEQSPFRNHSAEYEQLIEKLDALLINLSAFDDNFLDFRQALTGAINQPFVNKQTLLQALHDHFLNKEPSSSQAKIVGKYINRCLTRVSDALPEALQNTFNALIDEYTPAIPDAPFSQKKTDKANFLNHLLSVVQIEPTKTYSECIHTALNSEYPSHIERSIRHALEQAEPPSQSFFCQPKHRFIDFIRALKTAEPDYETTALLAQSTSAQPC